LAHERSFSQRSGKAISYQFLFLIIIGLVCGNFSILLHAGEENPAVVFNKFYDSQKEKNKFGQKTNLSASSMDKPRERKLWTISLYGIYGLSNLDVINEYIQELNIGIDGYFKGDFNKIKSVTGASLCLSYQSRALIGAGLEYEYLRGASRGTMTTYELPPPSVKSHEIIISTHGYLATITLAAPLALPRLDIKGMAGAGVYFTKYYETIFIKSEDSTSLGFKAGIGLSYFLTDNLGISLEACYRMVTLKSPGVAESFPLQYGVELAQKDFNGFGLALGICLRL